MERSKCPRGSRVPMEEGRRLPEQPPKQQEQRNKRSPRGCQISPIAGALAMLTALACLQVGQSGAELFDLVRLSSLVNASYTAGEVALVDPLMSLMALGGGGDDKPHEMRKLVTGDLASSGAKQPPVYLSAPKQISSTKEIHKHHQQPQLHHQRHAIEHVKAKDAAGHDLHVAADHYSKKSSKKKHQPKHKKITIKKKKKKVIVKKVKKVKKYKKVKVVVEPYKPSHHHHHHQHQQHHHQHHHEHHQPAAAGGKFYEYREVPKKGAWKFGYKRGNAKHTIERKEDGHKSHFKSVVKWMADKGKGHHLFDYNHGDHHKKGKHQHHHQAAAAASVPAAKVKPQHQQQHQKRLV